MGNTDLLLVRRVSHKWTLSKEALLAALRQSWDEFL